VVSILLVCLAGVAAGTLCNFIGSKLWVFAERRTSARRAERALAAPEALALLGIVLVAVLLRSSALSKESLWFDEAYAWRMAIQPLAVAAAGESTNPPLYYILLHFWVRAFGTSEAALRSLSVIPSSVAVLLVFGLGRRLYNGRVGLSAAGFMAVSSFHMYYAQEARCFAWLLVLLLGSMLSMDVALRSVRRWPRRVAWLCYVLTTCAALYTHFYAVFFVVAETVFVVGRWKENRDRLWAWAGAQVLVGLAFLPWLIRMLGAVGEGSQARRYLWLKGPQALFSFLAGDTLVPLDETAVQDIHGTIAANWPLLVAAGLGFGVFFVAALTVAHRHRRSTWFVTALGLGPMVMAFVVSLRMNIFDERYLIGVTPLLYLFLASGAVWLFRDRPTGRRGAVRLTRALAVALVVGVTATSLLQYYFHPRFGKEQWREVTPYIEARAKPDDIIVFDRGHIGIAYDYYAAAPIPRLRISDPAQDESSAEWVAARNRIREHRRVWLVRSHFFDDAMLHRFRKDFVPRCKKHFPTAKGIDVYLLRPVRTSEGQNTGGPERS
jgi:4-amino-4-deoxy-L-arabinose transferase-like glycosyltransferase